VRADITAVAHVLVFCMLCVLVPGQSQPSASDDALANFRPRREMHNRELAGSEICARCHVQKARQFSQSSMAHALGGVATNDVLRVHPHLTFRAGNYAYEITYDGANAIYRVSYGNQSISEPIAYVFGNARVAQTYVLRHNGKLYEGRVSYYSGIDALDWTIGDALNPPPSLDEAFGRDITGDEARNCFSCHGTAAVSGGRLALDQLIPGVSCEACHGPGLLHAEVMQSGRADDLSIFNPKMLDPDTLDQEFCGACHRSANTVGMMPDLGGISNVRFQPYRLASSRGHDSNDPRFACTACHDPHHDLPQQGASSDSKCTVCHSAPVLLGTTEKATSSKIVAKSCRVSNSGCDGCHMPKVEIPGAHFQFTDHRIRIVRPGEKFPM